MLDPFIHSQNSVSSTITRMADYQLPIPIITRRLVIRDAIRSDMRGWSALYRSPKVRQYMNGPLRRKAQEWWTGQQSLSTEVTRPLSIALPNTNELVGVCGFFNSSQHSEWEAWLLLRSKFWQVGIGSEVMSALVEVAFSSLAALRVIAIVDPENNKSLSMLKKLGFGFVSEYSGTSNWQNGHHIYAVEHHTYKFAVEMDAAKARYSSP